MVYPSIPSSISKPPNFLSDLSAVKITGEIMKDHNSSGPVANAKLQRNGREDTKVGQPHKGAISCRRIGPGLVEYDVADVPDHSNGRTSDSPYWEDCNSSLSSAEDEFHPTTCVTMVKPMNRVYSVSLDLGDDMILNMNGAAAREDEIEMLVEEALLDIASDTDVVYPGQTLTL